MAHDGWAELPQAGFPTSPQTHEVVFGYDGRKRLIQETRTRTDVNPDVQVYDMQYTYDQLGNRTTKLARVGGQVRFTAYLYDTDLDPNDPNDPNDPISVSAWTDYLGEQPWQDYALTRAPNSPNPPAVAKVTRYLAGAGIHAQADSADEFEPVYLHGDLIRSTVMMTDAGGQALATTAYTAFGELVGDPNSMMTRYRYAGGWGYESGLISLQGANTELPPITLQHVGARWYQPGIGRFVQRDPIGIGGGLNVYGYMDVDPVTGADPHGFGPVRTAYGWRDPATGRFTKAPWWRRSIKIKRWKIGVPVYLLGKLAVRGMYCAAGHGADYRDPEDELVDWVGDLVELAQARARERASGRPRRGGSPPGRDPPMGMCFVEGTGVFVGGESVEVQDLPLGAPVVTVDPLKCERSYAQVVGTVCGLTTDLVSIYVEDETLTCTAEHPFWVVGHGWTRASLVCAGDCLWNERLEAVPVRCVDRENVREPRKVYGITVSDPHTYFVGAARILVHNKTPY